MKNSMTVGPMLAVAAIAFALADAAFAQSMPDASSPDAAATTTTTTATPSTATRPRDSGQGAQAPPPSIDAEAAPSASIGSTGLDRSDSANVAFAKLDVADHPFLTRDDVAQLPGFGDAFAQADHDGDGRLDRSEFVDAWSYYVSQAIAETTTTTTTSSVTPIR